jgi:putative hemolysin
MLSIEDSITERLPWLKQLPLIRRSMAGMLGRLADEDRFNRVLERAGAKEGFEFVDCVLETLGTRYHVNPRDLENIPVDGPLLVVANHPLGMQDALALLKMVG